jgi:hypothetical protein
VSALTTFRWTQMARLLQGGSVDQSCTGNGDHGRWSAFLACSAPRGSGSEPGSGMPEVSNGLKGSDSTIGEHRNDGPGLLNQVKIKISHQ